MKTGSGDVYEGEPKNGVKPSTTMTIDDEDYVKLVEGKLNAQQAFMSGKLKIKGNIMLTQKLGSVLQQEKAKL